MNRKMHLAALTTACGSLFLSGCVSFQNCAPETDSQGNRTGRMRCPVGSKGGAYQTQISSDTTLAGWAMIALAAVFEADLLAQATTMFNPSTFDATQVRLETAGSTVPVEGVNGQFVLKIYSGTTLLAASSFGWLKSGTSLIVANPGALTAWVRQFPTADGFSYDGILTFAATTQASTTVASAHVYNGVVAASNLRSYSSAVSGTRGSYQER